MPLDEDGIPILTADLREIESIRDSLHNVDRLLVGNQAMVKDALLNFETYTASLAGKGDAIESIMRKADDAFASMDSAMAKIDNFMPGLADGKAGELLEKVQSIRELAESFNKKSATVMEEGRRSLLDVSEAAVKFTRKIDPQAVSGGTRPRRESRTRSGRRALPAVPLLELGRPNRQRAAVARGFATRLKRNAIKSANQS